MMRGVPGGGAVGPWVPWAAPPELAELPDPLATLPVTDEEARLSEPTVPVVGRGMPALPTPLPRFGVTVVSPAPVPPGMPAADRGVCAGAPGWPGAVEVEVPDDVPPVLPLLLLPAPPPLLWASASDDVAARKTANSAMRTGMGASCRTMCTINGAGRGFVPGADNQAPRAPPGMSVDELVRSRGLEPPRVAPLAPQASASTNSATTACEEECRTVRRWPGACNKSVRGGQGLALVGRSSPRKRGRRAKNAGFPLSRE